MSLALAVSMSLFAGVGAEWGHPLADKFEPLLTACEGLDNLTNCSASFTGVCKTLSDGNRSCHSDDHPEQHHEHHGYLGLVKGMKDRFLHRGRTYGHQHGDEHAHPVFPGDCAGKQDGETCTFAREGRCIPSGKCPVFKGRQVCKPWDSHPPAFLLEACKGQQEGDICRLGILAGKCEKVRFEEDLQCKTWLFKSWRHGHGVQNDSKTTGDQEEHAGDDSWEEGWKEEPPVADAVHLV